MLALTALGCGGGIGDMAPRASAPEAPSEQSKCKIAASQQNPLVTEWPASEKSNLEARLREGGVVVAYSGCTMRMLPQCRVKGSYVWQRTTPATDSMEIRSEDELYAKLPLGAVSLEGELKSSGRLAMQTTVSGQLKLTGLAPADVPTRGECSGATHVVASLTVGAFKLKSGGDLSAKGGVGVAAVASTRGGTSSSEALLRQAGNPDRCSESTDERPNTECASPIQMFLWTLPSQAAAEAPPGTVKVAFSAAQADSTWEIVTGDKVLCTTPCSKWVDPATPFLMRDKDASFLMRNRIEVTNLKEHAARAPLVVQAHSSSFLGFAGGATITSVGGMAAIAGITLSAIGCSQGGEGASMCKGGIIAGSLGALALIPGIWIIVKSGAHAEITTSATDVPNATSAWRVAPGSVLGRF
jgi:hypothetical protein